MMSPRLETVELTIQHVRNGRERMPVVSMHMSERPLNPVECETVRYRWILVNIVIVVVVHELVPEGLAEDNPDNSDKEKRDKAGDEVFTVGSRKLVLSCAVSRSFFPLHRLLH